MTLNVITGLRARIWIPPAAATALIKSAQLFVLVLASVTVNHKSGALVLVALNCWEILYAKIHL